MPCVLLRRPRRTNRLTFVVDPVQHRSSDSVGIIECVRVALDRIVGEAMGYVRRGDLIEPDGDCRVVGAQQLRHRTSRQRMNAALAGNCEC
jgi:hypothetical protein